MTTRAQKIMEAFYLTFADKRQDFIIQKLNNDALANALRAVADRFATDWGELQHPCDILNEIADVLEAL